MQNDAPGGDVPPLPAGVSMPDDAFDEGAAVELIPCGGCGRKFKESALERHAKICKAVFCDKRKAFDSAANRLGELENADSLIQKAKVIEKEAAKVKETVGDVAPGRKPPSPSAANGGKAKEVPAWKKKSLEFRAAMLASKVATGDVEAEAKQKQVNQELSAIGGNDPANDPSKLVCPHCGRSFNKEAGARHVEICVKTFGGKKGGGGRLVRGAGKNASAVAVTAAATAAAAAAQVPTAARNDKSAAARRTNAPAKAPGIDEQPAAAQARRVSNGGERAGSRGPPPLPGGRGDQPPSRERVAKTRP